MDTPNYGVAILTDLPDRPVRGVHVQLYGHRFAPDIGVCRLCWNATLDYEDGGQREITGGTAALDKGSWRVHMPSRVLAVDGELLSVRVHLPYNEYLSVRNAIFAQLDRGNV